jgi:hypothetical protein
MRYYIAPVEDEHGVLVVPGFSVPSRYPALGYLWDSDRSKVVLLLRVRGTDDEVLVKSALKRFPELDESSFQPLEHLTMLPNAPVLDATENPFVVTTVLENVNHKNPKLRSKTTANQVESILDYLRKQNAPADVTNSLQKFMENVEDGTAMPVAIGKGADYDSE